ncbi:MAG: 2-oxoacid:acceptor oxidoreductase family protein [Candidatus Brocadiae bacterium]|nr:2-oxoacid:acceptor oxidoreductase family protein [Candidatus Brocadiia bacterium]
MGYITGKAATIYDSKNATFTQSYGPEARGGSCSAQVIISTEKISYPVLIAPDVLITMSQAAYNTFYSGLKPGGILIYDSVLVKPAKNDSSQQFFSIPSKSIAGELGKEIIANIVMLGYLVKVAGVVSPNAMQEAIVSSVPAALCELNIEAFKRGLSYSSPN